MEYARPRNTKSTQIELNWIEFEKKLYQINAIISFEISSVSGLPVRIFWCVQYPIFDWLGDYDDKWV